MSDIWGNIGVEISKSQGEWLYRVGGEVHGPVAQKAIVDKLLAGQISVDTPVALEGGEFHPLLRVAAFAEYLPKAQAMAAKRAGKKGWRIVLGVVLLLLSAGSAGGYYLFSEYQRAEHERELKRQREAEALARKQEERSRLGKMELVALVTLGTEEEVKIKSEKRKAVPSKRKAVAGSVAEAQEMVSSCERSQADILGTLGRHVAKLNVCVVDEKKRDTQGLLPSSLEIEFVVLPDGRVVDFQIGDRHYRKGTLNNCMTKVFGGIRFPEAKGSNCPITLPLKIGS